MTETDSKNFRTKTGHATVTQAQIVLQRTGVRGRLAERLQGESKTRTWIIYAFLCALLGGQGWVDYLAGNWPFAVIFWGLAGWIVYSLAQARNFTLTPIIPRETTTRVQVIRGVPGLTRDRLVVHFNDGTKEVQRYIMMPGVLQKGRGELDRAIKVLGDENWPIP